LLLAAGELIRRAFSRPVADQPGNALFDFR
jgi:hypothetical protein